MSHGLSERIDASGLSSHAPCTHGIDLAGRYQVGPLVRIDGRCCTHEGRDVVLRRPVSVTLATPESGIPIPRTLPLPTSARYRPGPGIGEIYDGGDDHGTVYLVTQPPEGATLAEELRHHRLTSDEVRDLGAGIARALLPAHRHGWAHGALEADTVGLGPDRVTVAGLGVGEWLAHWAQVDDHPHHPAPEQLADRGISPATDVFALGALLTEAAEPLPRRDPLAVLLRRMCADDPDERPTTEQVLDLLTAPDDPAPYAIDPLVTPPGRPGSGAAHGRSGPAVAAVAGLVVAAALTLATLVVRTSDASPDASVGGATVAADSAMPVLPSPLQFLIPPVARAAIDSDSDATRAPAAVGVVTVARPTVSPVDRHRATRSSTVAPTTAADRAERQDTVTDEQHGSGDATAPPSRTPTAKPSAATSSPRPTPRSSDHPHSSDSSDSPSSSDSPHSSSSGGADRIQPDTTRLADQDSSGNPPASHEPGIPTHRRANQAGTTTRKVDPTTAATVTAAPNDPTVTATAS